jgi:hypothetical protein
MAGTVVYVAEVRFDGVGWVTVPEEFATQSQADMRAFAVALRMNGQDTRVIEVPIGTKEDE